jgi:hypothetical protein
MDILTVDFETYYDKTYSLSIMQTDEYIKDQRFEIIGVSVALNDEEPRWYSGDMANTISWLIVNFDWESSAVRCHNTLFDGYILSQVCGIRPRLWMDTLAQARMLYPYLVSHSLAALAKHFKLPDKGTEVINALGKRRKDFNANDLYAYHIYCKHDTVLCRELGKLFDPFTPTMEAYQIDMTVRMFTEPKLVGDIPAIEQLHREEFARKEELLAAAMADRETLMSNPKFAEALEALGVSVPVKVSPRTGQETFAFAKSDEGFTALLDDEDPRVVALVSARLGVKTTIAETRALKFAQMSKRGPLCVYLNFWGAKTTGRYSGGNKVNWQNLPARGPSAGLRLAIKAPPGHTVLVGDSSNIELRTVMALAGQTDVLAKLAQGVDMYSDFASVLFGRSITKADVPERFLGKTAMLGLQYGAGALRFAEMVRLAARTVKGVEPIDLNQSNEIVNLYRKTYPSVVALWYRCNDVILPDIANGCSLEHVDVHGWFITQKDGFGRPGEPGVVYHDLQYHNVDREWTYVMGRQRVRIYGPKIVENLCQHAAMKIVMWQTARINSRYKVHLSVHDEAVCVVENSQLVQARAYMEECLSMAPPWCRGTIPIACETGIGESYGAAK